MEDAIFCVVVHFHVSTSVVSKPEAHTKSLSLTFSQLTDAIPLSMTKSTA
jgi:hypothetical protein